MSEYIKNWEGTKIEKVSSNDYKAYDMRDQIDLDALVNIVFHLQKRIEELEEKIERQAPDEGA